ncbi:MAG: ATP-binding cassette domain-containing protein, partial [Planctomycetota bacterium]
MASVVVQNVTKQFGPQVVLENVSLEVHTGELVGLVGANGAGKTTLFKLIVGQESPDTG